MYIHANLNNDNVCTGYGDLTHVEGVPSLVYLPDGWDDDLLWRKYESGAWSAEKFLPPAINEPSEIAQINLSIIEIWENIIPLLP